MTIFERAAFATFEKVPAFERLHAAQQVLDGVGRRVQSPGLDGIELCRLVRGDRARAHTYVMLLTSRDGRADMVAGLEAGADDYLIKPFDRAELRARVQVAVRMVTLRETLADRVTALEAALASVKRLEGLLPICAYCKRIRSDGDYWQQVEHYIATHADVQFTHGICPPCYRTITADFEQDQARRPTPIPAGDSVETQSFQTIGATFTMTR